MTTRYNSPWYRGYSFMARVAPAVREKNRTDNLCHAGDHLLTYWIYHAMIIQYAMDFSPASVANLRKSAMEYWDNAARAGRILDC